jgi:hypothetical protein
MPILHFLLIDIVHFLDDLGVGRQLLLGWLVTNAVFIANSGDGLIFVGTSPGDIIGWFGMSGGFGRGQEVIMRVKKGIIVEILSADLREIFHVGVVDRKNCLVFIVLPLVEVD